MKGTHGHSLLEKDSSCFIITNFLMIEPISSQTPRRFTTQLTQDETGILQKPQRLRTLSERKSCISILLLITLSGRVIGTVTTTRPTAMQKHSLVVIMEGSGHLWRIIFETAPSQRIRPSMPIPTKLCARVSERNRATKGLCRVRILWNLSSAPTFTRIRRSFSIQSSGLPSFPSTRLLPRYAFGPFLKYYNLLES
jgi:hypothetical protein